VYLVCGPGPTGTAPGAGAWAEAPVEPAGGAGRPDGAEPVTECDRNYTPADIARPGLLFSGSLPVEPGGTYDCVCVILGVGFMPARFRPVIGGGCV
jgi:hypothetical protein